MDEIKIWLNEYPFLGQILSIVGVLLLAIVVYLITKKIIFHGFTKIVSKSKTKWDDLIFDKILFRRIAYIAPFIVLYNFSKVFPFETSSIERIIIAIISVLIMLSIGSLLTAANRVYEKSKYAKEKPLKGYIQIIKLIIYIIGTFIIIAVLMGQSPWFLLSGVGALTAVILLIFRDTILSLVASLQISSNDLVRVGDWIEVPTFGADGDVIDIALHTIKIQNWDKTITVIPTHKLIDVSFKNWRGMQLTGGRRIKRAIFIDQSSIKFCDEDMLKSYEKIQLINAYILGKKQEVKEYNKKHGYDQKQIIGGRHLTNIGTFRIYVETYLKQHEKIHDNLLTMVRQLAPGPDGLPLEIYTFTNDINWIHYEAIQADIFDHILAVIPEFKLKIFQNPSGEDFQKMIS